jgi:hypothetical protein
LFLINSIYKSYRPIILGESGKPEILRCLNEKDWGSAEHLKSSIGGEEGRESGEIEIGEQGVRWWGRVGKEEKLREEAELLQTKRIKP